MKAAELQSTIQHLTTDLCVASDQTLLKVTHVIDTLPDRGAADDLLGPVRGRLGALNPPRPPSISRILFRPLDGVIIATTQWNRASCALPRGLIRPVADFIEAGLVARSGPASTMTLAHSVIWSEAASILGAGGFPESWKLPAFEVQTGIRPQLLPILIEVVRIILAHATALLDFAAQGGADFGLIRPLVNEAARAGPLGWRVALALLVQLSRKPARIAEQLLEVTRETRFERPLNQGIGVVLGCAMDELEAELAVLQEHSPPSAAAIDARTRLATRLESFSEMRGELRSLARRASQDRLRLAAQFSDEIAKSLHDLPGLCRVSIATATQVLEAIRRLDTATRPLGGVERRVHILDQAAQRLASQHFANQTFGNQTFGNQTFGNQIGGPEDKLAWLTYADRLRLCEMLVGPEAALRIVGPEAALRNVGPEAALRNVGPCHAAV